MTLGHPQGDNIKMLIKIIRFVLAATTIFFAGTALAQITSIQSKQYEDGGFYEGTFKNGRQHGQGTYSLPSGYKYTGAWVNGEISGDGVAKFADGSVYEGSFSNGKPEGSGTIVYANGGTYFGTLVGGKIDGQGVATYEGGLHYEGGLRSPMHHG